MKLEYALIGMAVLAVAYIIYRFNKRRKNSGSSSGTGKGTRLK